MLTYTLSSMISCDKQYSYADNDKTVFHIQTIILEQITKKLNCCFTDGFILQENY